MTATGEDTSELFRRARGLASAGQSAEADRLFRRILEAEPGHVDALAFLGLGAFERGEHQESERWLRRALELRPDDPMLRQNLGLVFKAGGDAPAALAELDRALAARPALPLAHLHRGELLARLGRDRDAADALARAVALNPNLGSRRMLARAPAEVAGMVAALEAARDRVHAAARRDAFADLEDRFGGEAMSRARRFLEVFNGERSEPWADSRQTPSWMYFPGLAPRPWFEREEFEWVATAEAAAPAIRRELETVLAGEAGVRPYVPEEESMPEAWQRLAGTLKWGSYHLYRGGRRQMGPCRDCPETAALLERIPLMDAPGHAPEAFFSILQPGTHIPPHVGLANTKLAVHLALAIPENCSITVGGETRTWHEGRVLVFDDSFRHEARNDSDAVRAVLITEIWNPQLTEAERESVRAIIAVGEDLHRHWIHVAEELKRQCNNPT